MSKKRILNYFYYYYYYYSYILFFLTGKLFWIKKNKLNSKYIIWKLSVICLLNYALLSYTTVSQVNVSCFKNVYIYLQKKIQIKKVIFACKFIVINEAMYL